MWSYCYYVFILCRSRKLPLDGPLTVLHYNSAAPFQCSLTRQDREIIRAYFWELEQRRSHRTTCWWPHTTCALMRTLSSASVETGLGNFGSHNSFCRDYNPRGFLFTSLNKRSETAKLQQREMAVPPACCYQKNWHNRGSGQEAGKLRKVPYNHLSMILAYFLWKHYFPTDYNVFHRKCAKFIQRGL